jgi:hypothetical protein
MASYLFTQEQEGIIFEYPITKTVNFHRGDLLDSIDRGIDKGT